MIQITFCRNNMPEYVQIHTDSQEHDNEDEIVVEEAGLEDEALSER